jgi:hypothetical protein
MPLPQARTHISGTLSHVLPGGRCLVWFRVSHRSRNQRCTTPPPTTTAWLKAQVYSSWIGTWHDFRAEQWRCWCSERSYCYIYPVMIFLQYAGSVDVVWECVYGSYWWLMVVMGQMYSMPAVMVLMTVHGDDGWQNGGICHDPGSWKTFIYVDDEKRKPPVPPVCPGRFVMWRQRCSITWLLPFTLLTLFLSYLVLHSLECDCILFYPCISVQYIPSCFNSEEFDQTSYLAL